MRVLRKLAGNGFLKLVIFVLTYALGFIVFSNLQGAGPMSAFFFIGKTILGSSISGEADSIVNLLLSFIITTAFYYFISLIISFIIMKIFSRD